MEGKPLPPTTKKGIDAPDWDSAETTSNDHDSLRFFPWRDVQDKQVFKLRLLADPRPEEERRSTHAKWEAPCEVWWRDEPPEAAAPLLVAVSNAALAAILTNRHLRAGDVVWIRASGEGLDRRYSVAK